MSVQPARRVAYDTLRAVDESEAYANLLLPRAIGRAALGRADEARDLFTNLLGRRNHHGLLAEHLDPRTGDSWGNFVQTYSMVGLINAAIRLSKRWDSAF